MRTHAIFGWATLAIASGFSVSLPTSAVAADGFVTDPATGVVYRRVTQTVQRPVVETKMTQQEQTVYTPETVVETRPEVRRTYTPVVQYRWKPKLEGRWNPFRQPTVAYQHVPETYWRAQDEVVHQTHTRVQWRGEKKIAQVPQQVTRLAQEQSVRYEPVGRVATATSSATNSSSLASSNRVSSNRVSSNLRPEVAARLRPLEQDERVAPMTASSSLAASGQPRSSFQTGMRPSDLMPNRSGAYGATTVHTLPLPTAGVATLPATTLWR